jgi:hypothetical protein
MLSPFNRVAITSGNTKVYGGGGVLDPHPHIMYYGKELTRESLGVRRFRDPDRHTWEPVLTGQNSPFAYIVQPIGMAAVEEIMNDPESMALIKAMQPYLK